MPCNVYRQKVIGNYIVDFYCADVKTPYPPRQAIKHSERKKTKNAKIVIEIDGSQHYEENGQKNDHERDAYLNSLGITVLRYSNFNIKWNFEEVCADVWGHIFPE